MSYDTVIKFKIDCKNMTITGRYRSSNSWDWNGKRIEEDYTKKYDSIEKFKKGVFDVADDALSGSLKFSNTSTMGKRLIWLSQNNKLHYRYPEKAKSNKLEDAWYKEWLAVERNEETFKVLVGVKRVKPKTWVISNGGLIGVKVTPHYTKLSIDRWKKFYNLNAANEMMKRLTELGWVKEYGLKVVEA